MESTEKVTTPCSSDAAACNPAAPVRPPVADPDPDQKVQFNSKNWPRFLVVKSLDGKCITKHKVFVIQKAIEGIAGPSVNVKRLTKAGLLLIEVDRKQYAENLLDTDYFHNIPVSITEHRTLNSSKGVIYTDTLDDMSNNEITQALSKQGVKETYKFPKNKNGKNGNESILLTFDSPKPPKYIYAGYMRLNVRLYIPNPIRCYKCQKFGHTLKFCSIDAVCDKCGQSGHDASECSNTFKCSNCGEAHSASSRDCSQWKFRKEILKYKVEHDVSYPEAERQIINQRTVPQNTAQTYSSIVSKKVSKCEVEVQTDLTWPEYSDQPRPVLLKPSKDTIEHASLNKSVQSEENIEIMDVDNINRKRGRGKSSSSSEDDELPDIKKLNSKRDSNRLEDKDLPAPAPLADQQVSKEVGETPPLPQEEPSSGKATTEEGETRSVHVDSSRSTPPQKAADRETSKEISKSSVDPSSTLPEG